MGELVSAAMSLGPAAVILVVLAVFVLPLAVRILREYERGVIFRLGKLLDAKGPGLIFLIPIVDKMVRMDLRIVTIGVAQQEIMTRDNVPATVDAVVYFRIVNPSDAVVKVEDFL
jgi:regulator of protease activity HflC (stomatin/prohibitin superfamily)